MRALRLALACAVCAGNAAVSEEQTASEFAPPESTLQPFARGDVFIGATLLNDAGEKLVRKLMPEMHGGVSGSMGATHTTLGSDGHTLIYTSETGPRLMRFDLQAGAQPADLMTLPEAPPGAPPAMMFDVERLVDGRLVLPLGTRVAVLTESGEEVASFPLEGFGWALVAPCLNGDMAYAANWFTGEVVKLSLEGGNVLARVNIAPKCLAGIVQFH